MSTPVNRITLKTDVVQSAQDNLLYQFKDLPNINALVKVFAEELQELENEVIKLMTLRTLEEATGQQLDDIGETLGVARTTDNDELYRNIIKIRNVRQTGTGDAESSLSLIRLFTGDEDVSLYKGENYFVDVTFNDTCNPASSNLENIRQFFPVVTALRAVITSGGVPFGFDGDGTAKGFGSTTDPTAGGGFVSLLGTDL